MYKTVSEAAAFVKTLAPLVDKSQVSLAVPFTCIAYLANGPIRIGAQNMHDAQEGAFTGEISARMLKDAGARFVILGHSERRHHFHESSAFINRKVKRALAEGLEVTLCIGETLEERLAGHEEKVLSHQLLESLEGIDSLEGITLAYEPVWAIGTGKVASPSDAQKVHAFLRQLIAEKWNTDVELQYGGSVKPENAKLLLAEKDIDGLLVGGASLEPETFAQIVNSKEHA